MKVLTYVEIDVDYCANTYGVNPCTAELGVTGSIKCFNTQKTCQDINNFINEPVTLRFAVPTDYLPPEIECIPNVRDVSMTPGVISLGENMGTRSSVTVVFNDHPHSDTGPGFDKYHAERLYDPYRQGTMWGKFRARQPYLMGRPIRIVRGVLGQSREEMEVRHYVIDSFDGPRTDGTFSITAKDPLKLADDKRAQAPKLSTGRLLNAIDGDDPSLALAPSGIGNLEYPSGGKIAIGGKEMCLFSRSGDTMNLDRGVFGTEGVAHDAEERVQLVLEYEAATPAFIIRDLLVNYAGVDPSFIDLPAWEEEVATHLQRVYSALIPEPTGVNTLISELIQQAALALWWDDKEQKIQLRVLRGIPLDAKELNDDNLLGVPKVKEQPEKRLSQVWTYYGMRNPLRPVTEADNYRSALATIQTDLEGFYGQPAIKKIFSRWIPAFGLSIAERLNSIQLGRFQEPPRKFSFEVLRTGDIELELGAGYRLKHWSLQDVTGARASVPIQLTRLNPQPDRYLAEAEEQLFAFLDPGDLINRVIPIDSNYFNFHLPTIHDLIYPQVTPDDVANGVNLTVIINENVIVGSTSVGTPAFIVGGNSDWPNGFQITIINRGRIQGCGGKGGNVLGSGVTDPTWAGEAGWPGGTALRTRFPITLDNTDGQIWGGSGGGGASIVAQRGPDFVWRYHGYAAGGGGAGFEGGGPGTGGGGSADGEPGSSEFGGDGGFVPGGGGIPDIHGGAGGNPGQSGQAGTLWVIATGSGGTTPGVPPRPGGAAGASVDGDSLVTYDGVGDIRGPEIN